MTMLRGNARMPLKRAEKRGTVLDLYKEGLIPRNVASAQLGVTDQEFEVLLQRYR